MFLQLLTALSILTSINCQGSYFRDYYWRDYTGTIPPDAVVGGRNLNGTTYIGQVITADLCPVEITPGRREVYVPNNFPIPAKDFVKILCSNNFDRFRWYSTNTTDFSRLMKQKTVVRGGLDGYENPYYIGRAFYRNQLIVGPLKLGFTGTIMESMYWYDGDYKYYKTLKFDALVYEDPIYVASRRT